MKKIIIGAAIAIAVVVCFPILDLIPQFLMIVCIPLIFLVAVGLVGEGTYESIRQGTGFKIWISTLRDRIAVYRDELAESSPEKKL